MRTSMIGYFARGARCVLAGGLLWAAAPVGAQETARPSAANPTGGAATIQRATLLAPVDLDTDGVGHAQPRPGPAPAVLGFSDAPTTSAPRPVPSGSQLQATPGTPAAAAPSPRDDASRATPGLEQPAKPNGTGDLLELPLEKLAEQPVRVAEQPARAAAAPTATGALAQEQVASTLSRVQERVIESPGDVYVFTANTIKERGYRSLGELLQTVPGFTVFHRDLDFVVGVRGFNANDNDKITMLINGQNLNGAHEQDFSMNGPINLDNVERVEVIVGPSAFFQQANTLAATINIITKNVEGVELVEAVGNDLKYSTTVMTGHRWARDEWVNFSFTTEQLKGFDAWKNDGNSGTMGLVGRKLTGEIDQPSYFSVLNGQYGELTAQAVAYKKTWPELHIDNGAPPPINNGHMVEQLDSVFLKFEHPFGPTLTSVTRVDATLKEQTRLNDDGTGLPGIPAFNAEQQSVKQWVYTGESYLRYTGITNHSIQTGVQVEHDTNFDSFFTYNNPPNPAAIPPFPGEFFPQTAFLHGEVTGVGFYADDEYKVTDRLKLIAGIREDHNDKLPGDKWFTGARAAILMQPTEHWFAKVLYNRAVRMPSDLEAGNSAWGASRVVSFDAMGKPTPGPPNPPSFAQLLNPATEPEILSTIEEQNTFYIGKVRLGINFYHEELQDFISFFSPHSNGGNFRGNGSEVTFLEPVSPRVSIWANGAWNDTHLDLFNPLLFGSAPEIGVGGTESLHAYVNQQGRMIGAPAYTANAGFDYKILPHLNFSPAVRYFTEQAGVNFQVPAGASFVTIRNRYYFDAALTWTQVWGRNMDLRLSGFNLLNNRDLVAAQQLDDLYRPQGTDVVLTLYLRF